MQTTNDPYELREQHCLQMAESQEAKAFRFLRMAQQSVNDGCSGGALWYSRAATAAFTEAKGYRQAAFEARQKGLTFPRTLCVGEGR